MNAAVFHALMRARRRTLGLCITNVSNYRQSVSLYRSTTSYAPSVQYSTTEGRSWTSLTWQSGNQTSIPVSLAAGQSAYFRGDNSTWSKLTCRISFRASYAIAASGSVMFLVDSTGASTQIPAAYCFCELFDGCTSLVQAPELPATTLAEHCYDQMFSGCTSLVQAPELPATSLAGCCYQDMFSGCTSLAQAPALPAMSLAEHCYQDMFSGCTSLAQAPHLPATSIGINAIYYQMFYGCSSLVRVSVGYKTHRTDHNQTYQWLKDVAATGTFVVPDDAVVSSFSSNVSCVPSGWTLKTASDDVIPVPEPDPSGLSADAARHIALTYGGWPLAGGVPDTEGGVRRKALLSE